MQTVAVVSAGTGMYGLVHFAWYPTTTVLPELYSLKLAHLLHAQPLARPVHVTFRYNH